MNSVNRMLELLKTVKPRELDISSYSRKALRRTLDATEYYLEIFNKVLDRVLQLCAMSPEETILVDYGGGHGLLSIMAKMSGFKKVIYVDNNPDAVQTQHELSERMGFAPDVVIEGDSGMLLRWCNDNQVTPNALVSTDVIEHIYVLDTFFADLQALSPNMKMVFTTASNPYNKDVVHRLQKAMDKDEKGSRLSKGFWQLRRDHVKKLHPDMPDKLLDFWADNTRGLTYEDVARAVESQSPNLLNDKHNTCDPATGSWTERILPEDDYRQLLLPYGKSLLVLPGHYNTHCRGPKAWVKRRRNRRISKAPDNAPSSFGERRAMRRALKTAPFIYLIVKEAVKP